MGDRAALRSDLVPWSRSAPHAGLIPASRTLRRIGALDISTAIQLRNELGRVTSAPSDRVLLDLSDVPSVDGSGLGVLVAAHRHASKVGGRFALADPHERVARTLEQTGSDGLVDVHRSVDSGTHARMSA